MAESFVVLNPKFEKLVDPGTPLRPLVTGYQCLAGPAWHPRLVGVVFSDVATDKLYMWSEHAGVLVFRAPCGRANGNAVDSLRHLVTCEQGGRRLVRADAHGHILSLVDNYQDKHLNAPHDVAIQGDGTIWFTDPNHGLAPEQQEQPGCYLFRLDPGGALTAFDADFAKPSGLCFTADETLLYVSDTAEDRRHLRRFQVGADKSISGGEVFSTITTGMTDGFRLDTYGRIWASAGDGIWAIAPSGDVLGKIPVPEVPSSCTFGGRGNRTLFITAQTSLYAIELNAMGAKIW